jgi:pyruvate/2-oxoglutarate dehydrogenase complex dihydrolipoamide acyltransferase (E2) component
MIDLFGNDSPPPAGFLRPVNPAAQPSLFTAAAERAAFTGTRPISQERAELQAPPAPVRTEPVAPAAAAPGEIAVGADVRITAGKWKNRRGTFGGRPTGIPDTMPHAVLVNFANGTGAVVDRKDVQPI